MRHYLIFYTAPDGATVQTSYSSVLPMAEVLSQWQAARCVAGGSPGDVHAPKLMNPDTNPPPKPLVNAGIIQEAAKRYPDSYLDKVAFENGAIYQRDGKLWRGASPSAGDAFEAGQAWQRARAHPFLEWSPSRLAHALGYRIDLVSEGNGQRTPWLVGPNGRRHRADAERAWKLLARLAVARDLDPHNPPTDDPRALQNGKEVAA